MDKITFLARTLILTVAALLTVFISSVHAGHHEKHEGHAPTISEIAVNAEGLSTLVVALKAADLVDTLSGAGPFTVLAPTDDAFAALPVGAMEGLLADTEKLKAVLLSHVIEGKVLAETVVTLDSATALTGQALPIDIVNGVEIGGAAVIKTDILASNGVIHLIDKVITP